MSLGSGVYEGQVGAVPYIYMCVYIYIYRSSGDDGVLKLMEREMEHETQPGMIAILDIQAEGGGGGAHYE